VKAITDPSRDDQTHVDNHAGRPYLRVGIVLEEGTRRRWFWAHALPAKGARRSYVVLNREGESRREVNATTDRTEVVIGFDHEFVVKAAGMSLKYGWLEVLK